MGAADEIIAIIEDELFDNHDDVGLDFDKLTSFRERRIALRGRLAVD